jgi:hypothetical protein
MSEQSSRHESQVIHHPVSEVPQSNLLCQFTDIELHTQDKRKLVSKFDQQSYLQRQKPNKMEYTSPKKHIIRVD